MIIKKRSDRSLGLAGASSLGVETLGVDAAELEGDCEGFGIADFPDSLVDAVVLVLSGCCCPRPVGTASAVPAVDADAFVRCRTEELGASLLAGFF